MKLGSNFSSPLLSSADCRGNVFLLPEMWQLERTVRGFSEILHILLAARGTSRLVHQQDWVSSWRRVPRAEPAEDTRTEAWV